MTHRHRLAVVIASLLALAVASPAAGIIDGHLDETEHPYVGAFIAEFETDDGPVWVQICSGSLVSSTVFVTAGHCTEFIDDTELPVFVSFDPTYNQFAPTEDGYPLIPVTQHTYPVYYEFGFPNTGDVGVAVLSQPYEAAEYATLPAPGVLDQFASEKGRTNRLATVVGYGLADWLRGGGQPQPVYPDVRQWTSVQITNVRSANNGGYNLQHSGNSGHGNGATCFGDSGGPVLLGDVNSNLMVAVTSFGIDPLCSGPGWTYRLDRVEVLAFINGFLD